MIRQELNKYIEKEKAEILPKFFKAFPGGYGEGDKFLGVRVPNQRKVAKKLFSKISLSDLNKYLNDPYHEVRLTAIFILVLKYEKSKTKEEQQQCISVYLKNLDGINNWDLVDSSASQILGDYLLDKDRSMLYDFAKSNHLWLQRISIIATLAFIKKNDFTDTLNLAELLLDHDHDLIHKAVGWMLREVGNRNRLLETNFLDKHLNEMPRTTLRYAIEKFPEELRQQYLKKS